jgi:hypothetical protein
MPTPTALQSVTGFFHPKKYQKMLQLIFAFLMALPDSGGDTGDIPPTPPPPGS